jgi:hypothetical protein
VFAYGKQEELPILGVVTAVARIGTREIEATFYVVADKENRYEPLLSNKTSKLLGVLKVGESVESVCKLEQLSKLNNFQLKIPIDESVPPVSQPYQRLPFQLRPTVKKRIDELLAADVIEKVEGPTLWVSPIVVEREKMVMCGYALICVAPTPRSSEKTFQYQHLRSSYMVWMELQSSAKLICDPPIIRLN